MFERERCVAAAYSMKDFNSLCCISLNVIHMEFELTTWLPYNEFVTVKICASD
jgi:hypothetical protein